MAISYKGYQTNQTPRNHMERGRPPNPPLNPPNQLQQQQSGQPQSYYGGNQQQQQTPQGQQLNRGPNPLNAAGQPNRAATVGQNNSTTNPRMGPQSQTQQQMAGTGQQQQQKKPKFYLAMFDYDPTTMSPNPDGCEEELPFQEGDTIKVSHASGELSILQSVGAIGIGFLKSLKFCGSFAEEGRATPKSKAWEGTTG